MYKVYCDNHLLYSPELEDYVLTNPKVDVELNKTGSFTFSIYPNHPHFYDLQKLKSIVTIYRDGGSEPLFRGRILDDEQGFYNEKQVTCEGELAFLLDSIQRPYDYQTESTHKTVEELFTYFIEQHNLQVESAQQFNVGVITVNDPDIYVLVSDYTYMNTWDSINKKLIESEGGYLRVRHEQDGNYIDYLADLNTSSNQTIEFGKNLLDITKSIKGTDIGTAVIPLGAKLTSTTEEVETDERLTIKDVNGGLDYIYNQEAVNKYRWIYKTVIFENVTDASELLLKGKEYLAEVINLSVSIDLTAVDLAALNTDINSFNLGTNIHVKSVPHNLDTNMLVTKLSIDLLNPQSNKLTLGTTYNTFTEQTNNSLDYAKEMVNNVDKKISDKVTIKDVTNMCYTKSLININQCQRVKILKNNGDNIITDAVNLFNSEISAMFVTIIDNNNKYYFGTLFLGNTNKLTSINGDLTCSVNGGTINISSGTSPYTFTFYA